LIASATTSCPPRDGQRLALLLFDSPDGARAAQRALGTVILADGVFAAPAAP